jgi:hypothetical protein
MPSRNRKHIPIPDNPRSRLSFYLPRLSNVRVPDFFPNIMILLEPFIRQPEHQNSRTPHLVKFPYNVGRTSRLFFGCLKFLYVLIVYITSSFLLSYCRFNKSPSNSESLSCSSTLSAELFSYEIMRLFAWEWHCPHSFIQHCSSSYDLHIFFHIGSEPPTSSSSGSTSSQQPTGPSFFCVESSYHSFK